MSNQDGDHYNLRPEIYPVRSGVYPSVFSRCASTLSTAARYSTSLHSMKTSPTLTQWLEVVEHNPEYAFTMESPNPPYQAYQWMDEK